MFRRWGYFNIVFVISAFLLEIRRCQGDTVDSDFMKKTKAVKELIMTGYDKWIRPTRDGSNTTEVHTGISPRQIIDVDETRGLLILDSYFWMAWDDSRLNWTGKIDYNNYLSLPVDQVWRPDITVHNSHSLAVDPTKQVLVTVADEGIVFWVPPIQTETACDTLFNITSLDAEIECTISLGSWVHDGWEIEFTDYGVHMDNFENINPRWEVIESKVHSFVNITKYDGYDEPYMSVVVMFPMRRRPIPEIEATRNPCILVMIVTLSVFWLPTNSSKKITILGLMLLSLTILLIYVAGSTRFPAAVLFAVTFLQSTMYIVVATFLFQLLVIFNLCKSSGSVRPPPIIMQLLSGPFGKYTCLESSISKEKASADRLQLKEDSARIISSSSPRDDWMLLAAGLDRLFFVVMSVAMIAIHHL